jgi:hypothetical protein
MHAVLTLKQSSQRGLWEVILHLQQVDEFWLPTAPLNNLA